MHFASSKIPKKISIYINKQSNKKTESQNQSLQKLSKIIAIIKINY